MKTLLEIRSSIYSDGGQSSRLADRFVAQWRAANADGKVIVRDLAREPVPHIDAARFGSFLATAKERTPAQQAIVAYSDALIEELQTADVIVFAVPMYNFGIPSTLKAYFDHVARAGVTFRYTANGPEGLLTGKHAYVFAARGGLYAGTARDTQTPYLREFLGFVGITEVEFVYAEGMAISDAHREQALASANAHIAELVAPELEAA
ncbi:MAG TPA: NAD(P)H-dependent oxidoreductase [Casimicrobiaceae bacterium]|nr:NAD(P)H-dependent oxidoreductase [Casimicrobiaceae bacterium]